MKKSLHERQMERWEAMRQTYQRDVEMWGKDNLAEANKLLRKKAEYEKMKELQELRGKHALAEGYQMWIDEINVKLMVLRMGPKGPGETDER